LLISTGKSLIFHRSLEFSKKILKHMI